MNFVKGRRLQEIGEQRIANQSDIVFLGNR